MDNKYGQAAHQVEFLIGENAPIEGKAQEAQLGKEFNIEKFAIAVLNEKCVLSATCAFKNIEITGSGFQL